MVKNCGRIYFPPPPLNLFFSNAYNEKSLLGLGIMSESREYSKRERKRRGVDLSAIEKLKQARSGQAKAIDNIKV